MKNLSNAIIQILDKSKINQKKNILIQSQLQEQYYQRAKYYQQKYKLSNKAALCYYYTIRYLGSKLNSAIKDFANLYHQQGFTIQAIHFLKSAIKYLPQSQKTFSNLIMSFQKQVKNPTGNHLKKDILIKYLPSNYRVKDIKEMFGCDSRIQQVLFYSDLSFKQICANNSNDVCLIKFCSHSVGKKIHEKFRYKDHPEVKLFWVNKYRFISSIIENQNEQKEQRVQKEQNNENKQNDQKDQNVKGEYNRKNGKNKRNVRNKRNEQNRSKEQFLKHLYPFHYCADSFLQTDEEINMFNNIKDIWGEKKQYKTSKWQQQIDKLKQLQKKYTGQQLQKMKNSYIKHQNQINLIHFTLNRSKILQISQTQSWN